MTETETFDAIRYTADVVALRPGGDLLLIERGWPPHEGAWALPGGHVDPGETSRAAAARELEEESGVHVTAENLPPIGVWDSPGRATRASGTSPSPTWPSSPPTPRSPRE